MKDSNNFSALKIDEADSVETLVPIYQISRHYAKEDGNHGASLRTPDLTSLRSMVMAYFMKCG
jgi:hypothetical protein